MSIRFNYPAFAGLVLAVCLLEIGEVSAHAVITASSLSGQPLEPQKATRVQLNFNSAVELSLSKFDLVRKGDIHEAVPAMNGSKAGQIIVTIPPLDSGEYAIHYKVFAADGHLTEDVIRFQVTSHKDR